MASIAARKLRTVLSNVQAVIAVNLLVAAQAVEWRVGMSISPNAPTTKQNEVGAVADKLEAAEEEHRKFVEAMRPEKRAEIAQNLSTGTRAAYLHVRELVEPLTRDRVLEPDIRQVRKAVADGSMLARVQAALAHSALRPVAPLMWR
jgi:histidine ammonia-lyase